MSEAYRSQTENLPEKTGMAAWLRSHDTFIALGLTLLCVITRALAIPASMWEFDDHNFARAIHDYDIVHHTPHPPGFPIFIVLIRAAYFIVRDDHRALLTVNFVFASLLGAALFYLYREIFEDRLIALAGALLGCFAPSLWVHSLIARSDTPNLVLGIICLALIMRGFKSHRALLTGCIILGLGMGIRVTLMPLVGSLLALVLSVHLWKYRNWKLVAKAVSITGFCILSWYIPIVLITGWQNYRDAVARQSKYISETDTIFQSIYTPAERFYGYFIEIWGEPNIALTVYVLAGCGVLLLAFQRKWKALGLLIVSFLPFLAFTVFMNTPMGVIVYSMPYIPFFTGLVACALILVPQLIFPPAKWPKASTLGVALAVGFALASANWSYPLIKLLRKEASPPVRAAKAVQAKLDKENTLLYFDKGLYPHVKYYLSDYKAREWEGREVPPLNLLNPIESQLPVYGLSTEAIGQLPAEHFSWTPGRGARRLKTLSIGRFFDIYLTNISELGKMIYLRGWYQPEQSGGQQWRWMGKQGQVALQTEAEMMSLRFRATAAAIPNRTATVILKLDGRELARINNNQIDQTITVKTDPNHLWSLLTIENDQVFIPKQAGVNSDERELGLQCFELQWTALPNSPKKKLSPDQFIGEGWYNLESTNVDSFRWAAEQATVHLPAIMTGDARLDLRMQVPPQSDGTRTPVRVEVAGQEIITFQPTADVATKIIRVPAAVHRGAAVDLQLSTPKWLSVTGDSRKLAMAVYRVSWLPAGEESP